MEPKKRSYVALLSMDESSYTMSCPNDLRNEKRWMKGYVW
jgi:hypothetical protein